MAEAYEVRVRGRFSAVHQLRLADGSLEPLHGHDWNVEAVFRGPRLDAIDVLVDFEPVQAALDDVLTELHHGNLNTVPGLAHGNPSAERMARLIHDRLKERLGHHCPLVAVYIEEAPGCVAGYIGYSS